MEPDQIYSQLGTRFYQSARAEIIHRIDLRERALFFYLGLVGAYFGFIVSEHRFDQGNYLCQNLKIIFLLSIPLPLICAVFSVIIATHDIASANLGRYIVREFHQMRRRFSMDYPIDWDSSRDFGAVTRLQRLRPLAYIAVLCFPICYQTILCIEIFRIKNKCFSPTYNGYSIGFYIFTVLAAVIYIFVFRNIYNAWNNRRKIYAELETLQVPLSSPLTPAA